MDRAVDISGWPTLAFQYVLASFVVFGVLFLSAFAVGALLSAQGVTVPQLDGVTGVVVFSVVWLTLTGVWVRHIRQANGNWWGPVPREQYIGRFAGYGGLARHSWERAVDQLPDDDEDDDKRRERSR